ncbi:hypothetical protein RUND412_001183 [Rhizina undulata]
MISLYAVIHRAPPLITRELESPSAYSWGLGVSQRLRAGGRPTFRSLDEDTIGRIVGQPQVIELSDEESSGSRTPTPFNGTPGLSLDPQGPNYERLRQTEARQQLLDETLQNTTTQAQSAFQELRHETATQESQRAFE